MTGHRRQNTLVGVMLVMLVLLAGWCTLRMLGQRSDAARAAEDLAAYRAHARNIELLRERDAVISSAEEAGDKEQDLAKRITEAGAKARLGGQWLQDIVHKKPRRVEDSPYLRKPAVVYTQGLTLTQLTALLYQLSYDSTLTATELRLKTPRGDDPADRWDADITLSYLIYSPQPTDGPGS